MVNGQWREESSPSSISGLLEAMSLEPRRVAVELNKRIVARAQYASTLLADDDRLEIVTLVGGG
jgi:thiamine biosynthesis protein ThiS